VRDRLIERWVRTQEAYYAHDGSCTRPLRIIPSVPT
jgi:hypothetical protein